METLRQLQQHLPPFAVDVLRLSIWFLLLMVVFVPLERLCAVHPQKVFRKSFLTDLSYYFLTSLVPKTLLVVPMALIAWGLRHFVPGSLHSRIADLPLWPRLTAALVVGEVGFYWGHRWMQCFGASTPSIIAPRRLTGWSILAPIPSTSSSYACAASFPCTL